MLFILGIALHVFAHPAQLSEHLTYGQPGVNVVGRKLIVREGYALLHDEDKKDPLWVSYRLTKAYTAKNVERKELFTPDPLLDEGRRAELADYKASGWSRGHMAPANDMERSAQVMKECFYLSNMVPQNQPNNGGIWARLEMQANSYAKTYGDVTIITGPVFDKPMPGAGSNPAAIGSNQVAVPTWLYKIVVRRLSGGGYKAIAFEIPNKPLPNTEAELKKHLVSVRSIESDTGLNFLNALPTDTQDKLEKTAATALWSTGSSTPSTTAHKKKKKK